MLVPHSRLAQDDGRAKRSKKRVFVRRRKKTAKPFLGKIGTSSTIRIADGPPSPKGKARLAYGEREMIVYPFGNFFFMIL